MPPSPPLWPWPILRPGLEGRVGRVAAARSPGRRKAPAAPTAAPWTGGGDPDAAVARLGLEPGRRAHVPPHAFDEAVEEVEVHPADEWAVLLGQPVERTVRQRDLLAFPDLRLVAVAGQDAHYRGPAVLAPANVGHRARRLFTDLASG